MPAGLNRIAAVRVGRQFLFPGLLPGGIRAGLFFLQAAVLQLFPDTFAGCLLTALGSAGARLLRHLDRLHGIVFVKEKAHIKRADLYIDARRISHAGLHQRPAEVPAVHLYSGRQSGFFVDKNLDLRSSFPPVNTVLTHHLICAGKRFTHKIFQIASGQFGRNHIRRLAVDHGFLFLQYSLRLAAGNAVINIFIEKIFLFRVLLYGADPSVSAVRVGNSLPVLFHGIGLHVRLHILPHHRKGQGSLHLRRSRIQGGAQLQVHAHGDINIRLHSGLLIRRRGPEIHSHSSGKRFYLIQIFRYSSGKAFSVPRFPRFLASAGSKGRRAQDPGQKDAKTQPDGF